MKVLYEPNYLQLFHQKASLVVKEVLRVLLCYEYCFATIQANDTLYLSRCDDTAGLIHHDFSVFPNYKCWYGWNKAEKVDF